MNKRKTTAMAAALIIAATMVPATGALAECSLSIDMLGRRIADISAQEPGGSSGANETPASVSVVEQKLNKTTADMRYGATGYDITRNRLATARETSSHDTVPLDEMARSGVRHFAGNAVAEPQGTAPGPLAKARDYWQQARQLHARGNDDACSDAVRKANAALDSIKS
jgi:hypothetical protein